MIPHLVSFSGWSLFQRKSDRPSRSAWASCEGLHLRHDGVSSADSGCPAYIQSGLHCAMCHPWSLCNGKIYVNPSQVADFQCPTEETTKNDDQLPHGRLDGGLRAHEGGEPRRDDH